MNTWVGLKEFKLRGVRAVLGGSIVLMSSIRSVIVESVQGVYSATKAGLLQLARTLAAGMGKYNVRVNAIGTGVVDTLLYRDNFCG